ncbi:MAG: hypothetical protein ABWY55_01140 [Microbacterium sp.]
MESRVAEEVVPAPAPDGPASPVGTPARYLQALAVFVGATVAMLIADFAVSRLFVIAAFGGGPAMLIGIPVVGVLLILVIAGLMKAITGAYRMPAAITVAVLLGAFGAYGVLSGILDPLIWTGDETFALHVAICALTALALGLFLGPWPLRALGGGAVIAAIVILAVSPTGAEQIAQEAAESEAAQAAERLEYFRTDGTLPVLADLAGWRNARVHAAGSDAMTWVISDDGAVAQLYVAGHADPAQVGTSPCMFISRPGDAGAASPDVLPDWCLRTATGWSRSDGTGLAFIEGDRLITVNAADEWNVTDAGGTKSATAEDVALLAAHTRTMTLAEAEEHLSDEIRSGEWAPVDTPGL